MEKIVRLDTDLLANRDDCNIRRCALELFDAVENVEDMLEVCAIENKTVQHVYYILDWGKRAKDGNLGRMGKNIGFKYTDGTFSMYVNGQQAYIDSEIRLITVLAMCAR